MDAAVARELARLKTLMAQQFQEQEGKLLTRISELEAKLQAQSAKGAKG